MWRKGKAHTLPVGTPVDEATLSHSVISNSATLWTAACQAPVHGIFLARILEWVVISSSRATSWPRDGSCISCVSCIAGRFFTVEPLGKPLENNTEVPKKLKIELPYNLPIPLLGTYSKEKKKNNNNNIDLKIYLHPMFIAALFTIAKMWKQPKYPSIDEWIKKKW